MTRSISAAAVLFDMDGTLVDSTAVVESLWAEFAQEHGVSLADILRYAHGRQTIDTVRRFLPPGGDADDVTAAIEAEELVRLDGVVEVPGAARLLARLNGAQIAVVTSAPRELAQRRMRAAGLPVPRVLVTAEDVDRGKPAPDGYRLAASRLGTPAAECVAFEDAEAGIRAALASGAITVVVGSTTAPSAAGLVRIPDFTDVTAVYDGRRVTFTLPGTTISDGVVLLREWDVADAEWYAATAAHDELIQRFTAESPTLTPDEVRDAIAQLAGSSDTAGFVICAAETGERLGNIAVSHAGGIGDVSYWLAPSARGRGAATRALRLFSGWAFAHLALDELRLWTHVANIASRRVAERVGYERHPELDQPRLIKAETWTTSAYRLRAPVQS